MEQLRAEDRIEILELIADYAYRWDSKDADGVSCLYTEDAIHESYVDGETAPRFRAQSRLELRSVAVESFAGRLVGVQTRHHQSNTIFTEVRADSARTKTMFLTTHQRAEEPAPRLIFSGVFEDMFVKTADGWRFARRVVYIGGPRDRTGELPLG